MTYVDGLLRTSPCMKPLYEGAEFIIPNIQCSSRHGVGQGAWQVSSAFVATLLLESCYQSQKNRLDHVLKFLYLCALSVVVLAWAVLQATGAGAQLEQFLQDDLHRFMELREQMEQQASASDMAVLASTAEERQRRLSSTSNGSNSGISFVRLPDDSMLDADDDQEVEEHHPVAGALAAAAALAAIGNIGSPTASHSQQAGFSSPAQQATAAGQLQGASSTQAAAAAAGHAEFVLEADEEIAAQKRAARARLAELEGSSACLSTPSGAHDSTAASSAKACQDWDQQEGEAGSMHTSKVPERPRGLAAVAPSKAPVGGRPYFERLVAKLCELSVLGSDGVLMQHNQFLHHMVAGLLLCVVLLPVLWLLQADGGRGLGIVRGLLPAPFVAKAEQLFNVLHVVTAGGVLLYCLVRSLLLQPPLLHFREPVLERQYLLWSNSGRLFQDCLFQVTFLMVGGCLWLQLLQSGNLASAFAAGQANPNGRVLLSALTLMGSGLPVVMLIVLRSPRYVQYREPLLAGSRLCSMVAVSLQLVAGPGSQLQLNMPFIALAQVMSIACMQVRLSSFVPTQVLHLLVLLLCTRAANPLLQFTQLFGGWLCLPCVVLYSMEMHSRKAFLSTLAPPTPLGVGKALPAAPALGKAAG